MKRKDRRRRLAWKHTGGPFDVFLFGIFWGIMIGMTIMGGLLK